MHSDGIPYLRYTDTPEDGDSYQVRIESFTGGFSQYKTGSVISYLADTETVGLVPSTVVCNTPKTYSPYIRIPS